MKLISMTDYVLEQDLKTPTGRTAGQMVKYGLFLKQKLSLEMFVPCKLVEGVWVVLEEPKEHQRWLKALEINEFNYWAEGWEECREYQEAKDRVLFEGKFDVSKQGSPAVRFNNGFQIISCWTIEDLVKYNLELTQTAKKQIGL